MCIGTAWKLRIDKKASSVYHFAPLTLTWVCFSLLLVVFLAWIASQEYRNTLFGASVLITTTYGIHFISWELSTPTTIVNWPTTLKWTTKTWELQREIRFVELTSVFFPFLVLICFLFCFFSVGYISYVFLSLWFPFTSSIWFIYFIFFLSSLVSRCVAICLSIFIPV